MNTQTLNAIFGGLLHDVGKMVYRAGEKQDHASAGYAYLKERLKDAAWQEVLDGVRWHHAPALRQANAAENSTAYIVCVADNVAAAADRREIEGESARFDRTLPLCSVFTHLNGEHPGLALEPCAHDGRLRLPGGQPPVASAQYRALLAIFSRGLQGMALSETWLDSLLALLESCTANVPSSTYTGESPDISLYDHLKITAAVGACISEYLLDRDVADLRTHVFQNEKAFRDEPAFLLYTADLSGIQKFIYTVATKGAQKSLRSRSFFLEMLMEHYVDEVLQLCGLSRVNLIYSGGGHCYLLLPHTQKALSAVQTVNDRTNDWLIDQFGTALFAAHGWSACSANDLTNTPADSAPYKAVFSRVSEAVSRHKLSRYRAEQIRRLNRKQAGLDGRECRVCGSTDVLLQDRCAWCARFEALSLKIQEEARVAYVVAKEAKDADLPLPGGLGLSLMEEQAARERLKTENVVRVYTKNRAYTGMAYSSRLDLCDYYASNQNTELARQAEGIRRLAVCRLDVDNLGHAFVAGFEKEKAANLADKYHFVTLSRAAALSRQLSLFFKRYMREVLTQGKPLEVSVVYSGGDDVFLIGAWNHVIQAAERIHQQFTAFTGGSLTISGGIGLYGEKYPIRLAADETAALEERAKDEPGKNAVALFDPHQAHTYPWPVFTAQVMGEKYTLLNRFFQGQEERGMAFLYRLTELLRQAENDKLNLARYAYLLARLQPKRSSESYALYNEFSKQMYAWACRDADRRQLITAIYLYVYMNRKAD